MKTFTRSSISVLIIISFLIPSCSKAHRLNKYTFKDTDNLLENAVRNEVQFNGYTTYWHNDYKEWVRYGNLLKMSNPNVRNTLAQNKIDIAEELQVPGLIVQEGFVSGLFSETCKTLEDPSLKELEESIGKGNILVYTNPGSEAGKKLVEKYVPDSTWKQQLKSYQFGAANFSEVNAFYLEQGTQKIFVVASKEMVPRKRVKELLDNTSKIIAEYDLHKGWFGAETISRNDDQGQGRYLEVIGKGMNEGNTWFVFSGNKDIGVKDDLNSSINSANLPVVTDVGFSPVFGCKNYKGLNVEKMTTKQSWIDFARLKKGFVFRQYYDPKSDPYHYDGYIATEGNKKQIDNENIPFISSTGSFQGDFIPSMVLFVKKGEKLTSDLMWKAIMDRREVAVLRQGKMIGSALYRNALQMLLLDRVFLEEYFGDRIDIEADVQEKTLQVTISNAYSHAVSGDLNLQFPPEVKADESIATTLTLPVRSSKTILIKLRPQANGNGASGPIVASFKWGDKKKTTIALLDMLPSFSVLPLLSAHAPIEESSVKARSEKEQQLNNYTFKDTFDPLENSLRSQVQLTGNSNYRYGNSKEWIRYGNLFKMSVPNIRNALEQSKIDIAEDLQVPGLLLQEGFINGLFSEDYKTLEGPSMKELEESIGKRNILVFTDPGSEAGKKLVEKHTPESKWIQQLKDYKSTGNFPEVNAFYLGNGSRKIFVVTSKDSSSLRHIKELLENTKNVLAGYDLHKGWFGAETLLKSVTCGQGHPLEVIGRGMNEGNTWFVFSGYMEFWVKDELAGWINKVNLPIVTDVGFSPIYGCKDYNGLQVQDITQQGWIDFARQKNGYVFRQVNNRRRGTSGTTPPDGQTGPDLYDGYIASEGNKREIDAGNVPFVSSTGSFEGDLIPSMVLFIKKGEKLTRDLMWKAIMDRREVAVLRQGRMMGSALYRNALQMLLLDRVFLEEYFGDRIDIQADVQDYTLRVIISNTYSHPVSGSLNIQLPPEVVADETIIPGLTLPTNSSKTILIKLRPLSNGMNETNPIVAGFNWGGKKKNTMAIMDMPPAISVHRLLYGLAPLVKYPVSIHNFSSSVPFPVKVEVYAKDKSDEPVFTASQNNEATLSKFQDMIFDLKLAPGEYIVKVSALEVVAKSQLGVGKAEGSVHAYAIDLNNDGVNEYRLENDKVLVTLLTTGARVIEYIVKSKKDNLLFKLWPDKPVDDKSPFRERGFYPFGGFEDFLGQPGIETFKVFDATMIQEKGDYVQVKMVADFYGNKMEKTFTLYGNSPLLEIRWALTFKNPELKVIGPQPILHIGAAHGLEDLFSVPGVEGLQQRRMNPDKYYGRIFTLKEGWNAGYDEKADLTFVGAYPVDQPLFLHMWMNHPNNGGAQYFYLEYQPWVPITQKNTMYFSYYLWGAAGPWENGVEELRKRNLITEK